MTYTFVPNILEPMFSAVFRTHQIDSMAKSIAQKLLLKMVQEKKKNRLHTGWCKGCAYPEYAEVPHKPPPWWITEVQKGPPRVISSEINYERTSYLSSEGISLSMEEELLVTNRLLQ